MHNMVSEIIYFQNLSDELLLDVKNMKKKKYKTSFSQLKKYLKPAGIRQYPYCKRLRC